MFCFPRMDSLILTLSIHNLIFAGCVDNISKQRKSVNNNVCGFQNSQGICQKWTAVGKGLSSFQKFHPILGKCNTVTAELLENETHQCHTQCRRDFTNDIKLNKILKQQTKLKEEISAEITVNQQQEEPSDKRMCRKSKEIMKGEKCFSCDKKTKRKKRSIHLETLSRVERNDGSATLIDAMKKNEDLSDQWLHSAAKRLKVVTSDVDVLATDVFYHQSCYNRFVYSQEVKSTTKTEMTDEEISVLSAEKEFKILFKRKILIQKQLLSSYRSCRRNRHFTYTRSTLSKESQMTIKK